MCSRSPRAPLVRPLVVCALVLAPAAASGLSSLETSPLFSLADFSRIRGSSASLIRADAGVWFQLTTRGLQPDDATTVWLCGWNDPSVCVNGPGTCGSDPADLEFDVRGAFCIWGGAGIVDARGRLDVTGFGVARRRQIVDVLFGAFTDSRAAEINLVVKSHGSQLLDALYEQLTSFGGGCDVNECSEVQIAIFPTP